MSTVQTEAGVGPKDNGPNGRGGSPLELESEHPSEDSSTAEETPNQASGIDDDNEDLPQLNGTSFAGFQKQEPADKETSSIGSGDVASPTRAQAPSFDGSFSTPNDTPSVQVRFSERRPYERC